MNAMSMCSTTLLFVYFYSDIVSALILILMIDNIAIILIILSYSIQN